MKEPFNILIAGVGGQGNLVCGRVLADASIEQGLRPVAGDTFGASRRGGSVLTHLRIGKMDWGPLIPQGEVDILLGLEPIETLRAALDFAGETTIVLMSLSAIPIADISSQNKEYPSLESIVNALKKVCERVYILDTEIVLKEVGTKRVLNAFMLGALSVIENSPLKQVSIRSSIVTMIGKDEDNIKAFDLGVHECKKILESLKN
ncbi:hypothetical protein EU527_05890 [Candidatus Thorarchaeota archaeon]|nr:MAG: hypothetical protein EU527_05890 [Candidatus Thorarchaeota archaeon]